MPNNGTSLHSLAERMKAKTEQERLEMENLIRQQFNDLSKSLSISSQNALSTTETAIQTRLTALEKNVGSCCTILNWMFGKRLLQTLLLSCVLFLSLTLGGWGLIRWEASRMLNLRQETDQLKAHIATLETTVTQLELKTWGLELMESKEGRFIIFPAKTTPKPGWTFGNRQAVKLE